MLDLYILERDAIYVENREATELSLEYVRLPLSHQTILKYQRFVKAIVLHQVKVH